MPHPPIIAKALFTSPETMHSKQSHETSHRSWTSGFPSMCLPWYLHSANEVCCRTEYINIVVKTAHHRHLTKYVKLRVAHAPGMPGTFSPSSRVSDPDMHHGTCVTHVPWCMPGSLTSDFLWSRWRGKTSPAFPVHAQPVILRIWQEAHAYIRSPQHRHERIDTTLKGTALSGCYQTLQG